jgi:hypothetical protein
MTSYYRFVPSNVKAPAFMPTFDGNQYNVTVIWNVASQRYFIQCMDLTGNLIFFVPLVETEHNYELELMEWDSYNQRIVATTKHNINIPVGDIVNATITNTVPTNLSSTGFVLILNNNQFTFPYPIDPGQVTVAGSVAFLISMTKGYFASTLVFRFGRFEVSP